MKKYTPYLVAFSLLMSTFSFMKMSGGGSELYPFAIWRLFSRPTGSSGVVTFYKIYGLNGKDTLRLTLKENPLFDRNTQFSIIQTCGEEIANRQSVKRNQEKLQELVKITNPNYQHYILYRETFNPRDLGSKKFRFTKKPIAHIQ